MMTSIADIQRVFVVALAGLPMLPGFSIELPHERQVKAKLITIRRGEGGVEWMGGPLWSPV